LKIIEKNVFQSSQTSYVQTALGKQKIRTESIQSRAVQKEGGSHRKNDSVRIHRMWEQEVTKGTGSPHLITPLLESLVIFT
jgi:hypothetical protein